MGSPGVSAAILVEQRLDVWAANNQSWKMLLSPLSVASGTINVLPAIRVAEALGRKDDFLSRKGSQSVLQRVVSLVVLFNLLFVRRVKLDD